MRRAQSSRLLPGALQVVSCGPAARDSPTWSLKVTARITAAGFLSVGLRKHLCNACQEICSHEIEIRCVRVLCYPSINLGLKTGKECQEEKSPVRFNSVKSGQRIQTGLRLDFFRAHMRLPSGCEWCLLGPCVHSTICEIYVAFFPPKCWRRVVEKFKVTAAISFSCILKL